MDCQECNELLPLYVDQSLTQEEIESIRSHLESCSHCAQEMEIFTRSFNAVKNLKCVEAPDGFHERFQARFRKECWPGLRLSFWGSLSLGTVAAAAAVLLVVVLHNPFGSMKPAVIVPTTGTQTAKQPMVKAEVGGRGDATLANQKRADQAKHTVSAAAPVKTGITALTANTQPKNQLNSLYKASAINAGYSSGGSNAEQKPAYRMTASAKKKEPKLVRQRGEWSGDACALHQPLNRVVRTPSELTALWKKAQIQSISMPQLDWSKNMIGIICLGDSQGRGHEIMLREIQNKDDLMIVKYKISRQNSIQDGNITQPFMIFTLPKTSRRVIFNKES
ncbi:zf-HC2 domain-containing protein [bacterium]|nr:zf-HC2 domain-containing protein [bacterium]